MQCGDTITQDTTLDSDLLDCPGPAIIVGADGITIDLGGHTVSGQVFGPSVGNSGFDDVTVRNGRLQQRAGDPRRATDFPLGHPLPALPGG